MPLPMTTDEKNTMRLDGHASKIYASFYIPPVVYSAVLASVPASTDMVAQISFSSGSGTLANVKNGQSLYVGSVAGKNNLGICRIRKSPIAGTFYIGEQSKINWAAVSPVYLTVVEDIDLNPKHIHMDGAVANMDYDVAYGNQHTLFNPVPVLGPVVRVKKLVASTVTVQMGSETGYNSWVFGSTITTYAWTCATASAISSTSIARPTMTFNSTGWHVAYCTVTAANGKNKRGTRFVYIWSNDAPPYTGFMLQDFAEDYQSGGITFSMEFASQMSIDNIPNRALCVVFAEDYAGAGDNQGLVNLGHVADAKNILGIGRVLNSAQTFDNESGTARFEVAGYQELFKRITGFPDGVRMKNTPASWVDMPALTIDRALWHFLEWRTTATQIMDITLTGDTRYTAEAASLSATLWSQMEQMAFAQIFANIHVDHLGRLFSEIDPLLIAEADRVYPTILDLEARDIIGKIEMDLVTVGNVSQIDLSGVAVNLGGTAQALFALSPGHVMDWTGNIDALDRLLLANITQTKTQAGLIFAARNNPYPKVSIKLSSNNRMITCFPNQRVTYTLDGDIAPRGIGANLKLIPRRRKLSYDGESGTLETTLDFENETVAEIAVKKEVPGSGDLTFPPTPPFPPFPKFDPPIPGGFPTGGDDAPPRVLRHDTTAGMVYTENFNTDAPDWYQVNGGLTTTQYQGVNRFRVCPSGALFVARVGGNANTFFARAPFIGGTFEVIENYASIMAHYSGSTDNIQFAGFNINPLAGESIAYYLTQGGENVKTFLGSGITFVEKVSLTTGTNSGSEISFGINEWVLTTGDGIALSATLAGVTFAASTPFSGYQMTKHFRAATSGKTIHYGQGDLIVALNNLRVIGAPVTAVLKGDHYLRQDKMAGDPTGTYLMSQNNTPNPIKSSDSGASWSLIGSLPSSVDWYFAYGGGSGIATRWVAVGGGYIYYSDNFGTTWTAKIGNAIELSGFNINDAVKVIGF